MPDRFSRIARRADLAIGFVGVILLSAIGAPAVAGAGQDDKSSAAAASRAALPLSEVERHTAMTRVLAHPAVKERAAGHRLAGIRAISATTTGDWGSRTILTVVLFDHTSLETRRVTIDAATDALIEDEVLSGRPQRSPEELQEATLLIRRNPELARLLDLGAALDGGFIVDDPGGSRRRMIQLKLMSADRRTALRTITVDLTRQQIASVTSGPQPSARRGGVRP